MIRLIIWDLGDTLNTLPPGGQDTKPLDEYPEIRLRNGVSEVLRKLQERGYRQAVLSNTAVSDSDSAKRMLVKLGIDIYFDHVYATASELDSSKPGKPDPAVFHSVLQTMDVSPDKAVMVGNTWDTDIVGANRSGIHALWLQNPDISVRKDFSSPIMTPPWIMPVWDVANVPDVLAVIDDQPQCARPVSTNTNGFSHVTINVLDLEKSLPFYVETLGMKLVHHGRRDAYLEWGAAWICLQGRSELRQQQCQVGVDHVALYIDPKNFQKAVKVLQVANVPIVRGPVERGGGWTVNFLDPDGTQLEFHTGTLSERMKVWK